MTQEPLIFSHSQWTALLDSTFAEIRQLAQLKGAEYSGDVDRLANFRRNAKSLGVTKELIWAVYAAKHWDALMQYIADEQAGKERQRLESIGGRVDDLLTYLLLFKAMLQEQNDDGAKHCPSEVSSDTEKAFVLSALPFRMTQRDGLSGKLLGEALINTYDSYAQYKAEGYEIAPQKLAPQEAFRKGLAVIMKKKDWRQKVTNEREYELALQEGWQVQ